MNANMSEIRIESIASTNSYVGEDGLILECQEPSLRDVNAKNDVYMQLFGGVSHQRDGVRLVLSKQAALKLCGELWLYLQKVGVEKLG